MTPQRDPADLPFRRFCETGDPDALADVFDATAGRLVRVGVWLVGNRTDAASKFRTWLLDRLSGDMTL